VRSLVVKLLHWRIPRLRYQSFFSNVVWDLNLVSLKKINLSGIVGDPVQAGLVPLHIKLANHFVSVNKHKNCSERTDNIAPFVSVIFVVCDKLSGNHGLI